ncbi:pentatricopeptide repeat-containing protein 2, mitochondrial isoform X2 [Parasteatoda tepidariorum]|uniref:pentatricopeptide repeat-containing protein 2, mitochondrial isoform X2 n=1 Tax=Parasteatoda tepidariorum TaxID=114398 RepID=UPI00077F8B98|nr:pentatricopeptide repeat-containing protein 2, mitochondrial isoform X4 [Parasteatoda tepidariorum]XP_042909663.1 pentatricopeptide repeat-containing protein 2, mitochondrial isoform X3 [Parasteatoda tepidariorum]
MNSLRKCTIGNVLFSRFVQENKSLLNVRYLYNDQFLGIDKYVDARQRTITRLGNMRGNFFNRMKAQVTSTVPSMIFTEDLKTVIHSCEDTPEDIEVSIQMIKRYHKQNKELRFGTFIFGPVTMRLFYYLKKQDMIYDFFKDQELEGFFDQLKSYYLGMDIYFKNGKYEEILDAFDQLQAKKIAETKFPREGVVLATGACYKLNTPETFQRATELVTLAREARVPVLRKALTFVVALALNQNKPDIALEILSSIDRYNNITGNNLKLLAYAGLGRTQDAFSILRQITDQDAPIQSRIRGEVCQATLDAIEEAVKKVQDTETSHIFEQLSRSLKESNLISSQTIDELVCLPIEPRAFPRDDFTFNQRNRRFPEQSMREREFSDNDGGFPRRRRFAGIADD